MATYDPSFWEVSVDPEVLEAVLTTPDFLEALLVTPDEEQQAAETADTNHAGQVPPEQAEEQ